MNVKVQNTGLIDQPASQSSNHKLKIEPTEETKHLFIDEKLCGDSAFVPGKVIDFNLFVPKGKTVYLSHIVHLKAVAFTLSSEDPAEKPVTVYIDAGVFPRTRFLQSPVDANELLLQFTHATEISVYGPFSISLTGSFKRKERELIVNNFSVTNEKGDLTLKLVGYTVDEIYNIVA
jgi:hypothetical protein